MPPPTSSRERLVAELAVQRASIAIKSVLPSAKTSHILKGDSSPVTVADFAGQALLISALHHAFPSDRFVGEESADALRKDPILCQRVWDLVSSAHLDTHDKDAQLAKPTSIENMLDIIDLGCGGGGATGRFWVLDPVDGTMTFMRGEQFAVSLALIEDGKEVVGILGCPNVPHDATRLREDVVDRDGHGIMLSAIRGQGAHVRQMGRGPLLPARALGRFTERGDIDPKNIHFVDSRLSTSYRLDLAGRIAESLGADYPGTDMWSSHMRYAALTIGGGDAQVRIPRDGENNDSCVWDHAGGQLIFTERGGKITDLKGREMDFGAGRRLTKNWGMICAEESLYPMVAKLVCDITEGAKDA